MPVHPNTVGVLPPPPRSADRGWGGLISGEHGCWVPHSPYYRSRLFTLCNLSIRALPKHYFPTAQAAYSICRNVPAFYPSLKPNENLPLTFSLISAFHTFYLETQNLVRWECNFSETLLIIQSLSPQCYYWSCSKFYYLCLSKKNKFYYLL